MHAGCENESVKDAVPSARTHRTMHDALVEHMENTFGDFNGSQFVWFIQMRNNGSDCSCNNLAAVSLVCLDCSDECRQ